MKLWRWGWVSLKVETRSEGKQFIPTSWSTKVVPEANYVRIWIVTITCLKQLSHLIKHSQEAMNQLCSLHFVRPDEKNVVHSLSSDDRGMGERAGQPSRPREGVVSTK